MYNLHCDGSCLNNGSVNAKAGYGVVVEQEGKIIQELYGKLNGEIKTNFRAELKAVIVGLEYILANLSSIEDKSITIYSDSSMTIDGIRGVAKRKANRDLWEIIESNIELLISKDFYINAVHCNKADLEKTDLTYEMNVKADLLAYQGANSLICC